MRVQWEIISLISTDDSIGTTRYLMFAVFRHDYGRK